MTNNRMSVLEWDAATQLLNAATKIIIVTHERPDGDAMGSLIGLGHALREHGKDVTLAVDGGTPQGFRYLRGSENVLPRLQNPQADLVISVDASDAVRPGKVGEIAFNLGKPIIVIDHHATNTLFGAAHIVDSDFVSTTEAVLRWLDHMGWQPSLASAEALMTGLITDTISFQVGPVTADTFDLAKRLMACGVDLRKIVEYTMRRTPSGMLQFMGKGLMSAKLEDHVIWTVLTQADFAQFGFLEDEKPELSSEMMADEEAYISALFTEVSNGDVRLSLRSKPGFDVGTVAFALGGGGHVQAAGCTLKQTSVADAVAKVIPLLKEAAKQGNLKY